MVTMERAHAILTEMGLAHSEVSKNKGNGVTVKGLNIMVSDTIGAVVYPEDFEEEDKFRGYVDKVIKKGTEDIDDIDVAGLMDYENAKDKICRKLINFDKNSEDFPMVRVAGDVGCAFFMNLVEGDDEIHSVKVTNEMLSTWGKEVSEVFEDSKFYGEPEVINMLDVLRGMAPGFDFEDEDDQNPMLVISNKQKLFGASMILTDEVKEKILDEFPDGAIILPSSIHELIAVKKTDESDPEVFAEMVQDVNCTTVDEFEVLSDRVYILDSEGFREYEKEVE